MEDVDDCDECEERAAELWNRRAPHTMELAKEP
jgi:hypothetical protein